MMEALKAIPFAKDLSHHDASHHVKNILLTIGTIRLTIYGFRKLDNYKSSQNAFRQTPATDSTDPGD
jgi:hypothetical protein